jgi:hypothetical protein
VRAFEHTAYCKIAKYKLVVNDGLITCVIPFAMSPFSLLAKPAKSFIKHTMNGTKPPKIAKAQL